MALLYIGVIINPNGLTGAMTVGEVPDFAHKIRKGSPVKIGYSSKFSIDYKIIGWKRRNNNFIAKIEGVESPEEAAELKEYGIFIEESLLPKMSMEEYAINELIGCKAIDNNTNELLGEITDVWQMPASDVWVIKTESGDLPVPYVDEFIKNVDIQKKSVYINVVDGLMEIVGSP